MVEYSVKENEIYDDNSIETCAITVAQKVIGGKWAFVLLHFISKGTARFGELRKRMPSVSQATLTKQLRILEEACLIHREVYPQVPPKVEYSLTTLGKSFIPVLHALAHWGEEYREFLLNNPDTVNL